MKSTTHETPTGLPGAELPQPANNAGRNTAETNKSPRLGASDGNDNPDPKVTGRLAFTGKHNATELDSINSQR